jgi:heme-degrading monooxygenase HmoA
MFSVLFEVHPRLERWDSYLAHAKMLKPELEAIDGFVDNIRYRSLTREGWLLSVSGWRDEKSLVRWRTQVRHHDAQLEGRTTILLDYHLRVGQITRDSRVPPGQEIREQRLDETEVGDAKCVTLLDRGAMANGIEGKPPAAVAAALGVDPKCEGLVEWDAYEAVLTPGDVIAMCSWKSDAAADAAEAQAGHVEGVRRRRVRVIRDYGMFDRREAPQYYPGVRSSDRDPLAEPRPTAAVPSIDRR